MTQQQNSWTRPVALGVALEQGQPAAAQQPLRGAAAPQPGVTEPLEHERLPKFAIPAADTLWWVGVHGGAGESTMAQLLPGSRAAKHRWPIPPPPVPASTVLVARTHAYGLRSAQRAAAEWASGAVQGVLVLGLVLVADAPGRLPRVLDDFADIVGGGVPRVWDVPWIEEWRRGEEPGPENTPDEVFEVLESIYALHGSNPSTFPTQY
ncbi:hypothetical protein GCM10009744_29990 [Kribbella alba]|uniref:Uncharacterized protein n=1 Tax=Kribbella alba TaxID=190197 RepID=A0ABP4R6S4_9ACTN